MPAWLGLVPSSLGREVAYQTDTRGACLLASVRRCVNERSLGRLSRYISMQVDIDRNGGKLRTGLHRRWGSFVASSGGRGRASSAAACPSLGSRTPISFTTARRPRTHTAERLLAGPRRGRRCTPPARPALAGVRWLCRRGTRGGRPVSGARRAGGYRLRRPCAPAKFAGSQILALFL